MTIPSNNKTNWNYIIIGAILFCFVLYNKNKKISTSDFNSKVVSLKRNIEYIKGGSRSSSFYRLWTNETKAAFKVEVPGGIATSWNLSDSLREGDSLEVKYRSDRETDLLNKSKEIPIYFLQKSNTLYFDTDSYYKAKTVYDSRWNWIMLIMGGLLILRGTTIINSKTTYLIGVISALIIITLRILNKF